MADKIVEFEAKGVIVTIPNQAHYDNVYVEKKPDYDPPGTGAFKKIRVVINIGFFVINATTNQKVYISNLDPPARIRIRYNNADKVAAARQKKKLAWWDATANAWVDLGSKNTSSGSANWEGYGDIETPGWPIDPPIAWGT